MKGPSREGARELPEIATIVGVDSESEIEEGVFPVKIWRICSVWGADELLVL